MRDVGGRKGTKGGRPYKWAKGHGPRTDGNKPEYFDEHGRFCDERYLHAVARGDADSFAPPSASEQDAQLKAAIIGQMEQMCSHTLARSRAGQSSVQLHIDKRSLQGRLDDLKPKDVTQLREFAKAHVSVLDWDDGAMLSGEMPLGPSLLKDTEDMLSVDDQLDYVDKCFAQIKYTVARQLISKKVADIDADLDTVSEDFRKAVAATKKMRGTIVELQQLTKTIRNYRSQTRHKDVTPLVHSTFEEINLPVPTAWQDNTKVAISKVPAASVAGAAAGPPTKRGNVFKRTLSLGDGTAPDADLAKGLKELMRKLKARGDEMTESLVLSADEDGDGKLNVNEFEELYKDTHEHIGLDEPSSKETNDAWASIVKEIPGSDGALDRSYTGEVILTAVEGLTLSFAERRKRRKMSKK